MPCGGAGAVVPPPLRPLLRWAARLRRSRLRAVTSSEPSGLVGKQQIGTAGECPGEGHPLALAARQRPGPPVTEIADVHRIEPGLRVLVSLGPAHALSGQAEGNVVDAR